MGHVGRRQFLMATSALFAAPHTVRAQQSGRTYVVGTLISGGPAELALYRAALRERLANHGFVEGRNLRIEDRLNAGDSDGAYRATREFVAMKVDAIFACGTQSTLGVQAATKSVPVVFTWVQEPARLGIVGAFARPGGNITGVTHREAEVIQKRFELALELAPDAKRIAILSSAGIRAIPEVLRPRLVEVAERTGVELVELNVFGGASAIENASQAGAKAVLTLWHLIRTGHRRVLEILIQRSRELGIPLIVVGAEEVEAGALVAYGARIIDDLQRAAEMLARVLKGEKPGDLPVDQASRFELAVNLKTAKAIGLTIPQSIMLRADRVIE